MSKSEYSYNYSDFSFCKDMFEKYGVLRQFRRSECFVHSGDVMEYVGWLVSIGFKCSLTASNGIDKTIGFALADSILINYESVKGYVHFKNSD